MTAIVAWIHKGEAFIVADSAESIGDTTPRDRYSSFGELQVVKEGAVQEAAMKILRLRSDLMVAIAGDAERGLAFVDLVMRDRRSHSTITLSEAVADIGSALEDEERPFDAIFAYLLSGCPCLTSWNGSQLQQRTESDPSAILFMGSIPADMRRLISSIVTAMKGELRGELLLMSVITFLQGLGINEYLPQFGIGGSFFGARLVSEVFWQEEIGYLIYPPELFECSPCAADDAAARAYSSEGLEQVASLVVNDAGVTVSSIAEPGARLFVPPTSSWTEEQWRTAIGLVSPYPHFPMRPAKYRAFLRKGCGRTTLLVGSAEPGPWFFHEDAGSATRLVLHRQLVEQLEKPVAGGAYVFTVLFETGESWHVSTVEQ